jgi:hypothetical protein
MGSQMMSHEEYEKYLTDLTAEEKEIEALMGRDLKQELQSIQAIKGHILARMERTAGHVAATNGHAASHPHYTSEMSLRDKVEACLKSVDEAWLSPTEIGRKLVAAGAVTPNARTLSGHISTVLKRRMNSKSSPNNHLESEKGRFRYRRLDLPLRPNSAHTEES